jgi:hypothetical protein
VLVRGARAGSGRPGQAHRWRLASNDLGKLGRFSSRLEWANKRLINNSNLQNPSYPLAVVEGATPQKVRCVRNILNALIAVILRHLATISCEPAPPLPRLERSARVWLATLLAPRDLFLLWVGTAVAPSKLENRRTTAPARRESEGLRDTTARNSTNKVAKQTR